MTTRTDWTEELFYETVEEVQASSLWQAPQAWAFGLLHRFGSTDLVARFVPKAINFGENQGMLAHVLDITQAKYGDVGSQRLYDEGVELSEYDLKELANRTQ